MEYNHLWELRMKLKNEKYKIKRPVVDTYIPLSDKLEKMLDLEYKSNGNKYVGERLIVRYEITK